MNFLRNKKLIPIVIITLFFGLIVFNAAGAGSISDLLTKAGGVDGAGFRPATTNTVPLFLGQMVQTLLAFLGIVFLILFIYGGFLWMTARGDEEQITKAKDVMVNTSIGLIIVLMSYAITFYIISKAMSTTLDVSGF